MSATENLFLSVGLLTMIIVPLAEVPYVDRPSIQVSAAESVEMPFKYVKGKDGKAIMPEVS